MKQSIRLTRFRTNDEGCALKKSIWLVFEENWQRCVTDKVSALLTYYGYTVRIREMSIFVHSSRKLFELEVNYTFETVQVIKV
jgi:hypothetical protein